MKDVDGKVDYLLGWWLIGILIVGIVSLAFYFFACYPSISSALPINTNISNKIFSTESTMVFEGEIKPYIKTKFGEDISDEYLIVQRKLLKVQLFRMENIEGTGDTFLIKNGKIKDIKPFDEYVVEKDGEEIRKFVTEVTKGK